MTSEIEVTAHNQRVLVKAYDGPRLANIQQIDRGEGPRQFNTWVGRELRITDIPDAGDNREQTLGEKRVRLTFNTLGNLDVDQIKKQTAELIDLIDLLKEKDPRLAALAMTVYEEAAMWAVKLATA